jgi:hypothetical protein
MSFSSLSPDTVDLFRWIAFGLLLLAFAGLAYAFVRKGSKIRSDAHNKPPPDSNLFP